MIQSSKINLSEVIKKKTYNNPKLIKCIIEVTTDK